MTRTVPHIDSPTEVRRSIQRLESHFFDESSDVDHDATTNFVAAEHIDHSAVSILAGTGLIGGGTLEANRTLSLSHLGLEALTDPEADRIAFWDESENAFKWLTVGANLEIVDTTLNVTGITIDHGALTGLEDDDHTQYLLANGTRALTGNMAVDALITIDGRDISVDGDKLDGIETGADVTDTDNVTTAGAAMAGGAFHDGFSDFVANEHIDHTAVSILAGTGLTGGGTLEANRTLSLSHLGLEALADPEADRIAFWDESENAFKWLAVDGTTITIADTTMSVVSGGVDHGALNGLGDDDHTQYLLANGTRALTGNLSVDALITIDGRDLSVDGAKLDGIEAFADVTDAANVATAGAAMAGGAFHDGFSDFVANEHINHTSVSITAGTGLTGGGDISANRTLALSHLGIELLTDPGANRVLLWDDTLGACRWIELISGLQLSPGVQVSTFGSLSGGDKWVGGVLAGNGCIYGVPFDSTTVLKIDPSDDSATTFGSLSGGNKWNGGALAANGYIYCIPRNSTTILKIDSSNDSTSTFGSLAGSDKWSGGVLAGNGFIYGIPFDSTTILKIDPSDDSTSTFGSLSGDDKWQGGVLAANGCIYGIPFDSTTILKIDTSDDSVTTFGSFAGSDKWVYGVLAGNGCIYCIPYDSTVILKIDPADDSTTTFGSLTDGNKWIGGVLAGNGCIYGIPADSTTILKIDPSDDSVTTFDDLVGTSKWQGGVLAGNGCIYGIPFDSTTVLKISFDTGLSVDESDVDHGGLGGLSDDDHTQYLLANGTRALTGNMAVDALITIDGRDISVDGDKLDGIEALADKTDAANVAAAGAAMAGGAFHDGFSDFVAAEHVALPATIAAVLTDHDLAAHTGLGLFDQSSDVDHNATTNYDANEHINHTSITLTAGTGISGGGTIADNRIFAFDATELGDLTWGSGLDASMTWIWSLSGATDPSITFANDSITIDNGVDVYLAANIQKLCFGVGNKYQIYYDGSNVIHNIISGNCRFYFPGGDVGFTDAAIALTVSRTTGNCRAYLRSYDASGGSAEFYLQRDETGAARIFRFGNGITGSDDFSIYDGTAGQFRFNISGDGDCMVGTTTRTTDATAHRALVFGDNGGDCVPGNATAAIFAKNVGATTTMHFVDEDGNVGQMIDWANTSTNNFINTGNITTGGNADVVQLTVLSNGSQSANIVEIKDSASNPALYVSSAGLVGIAASVPTALLDIDSDIIRLRTAKTPATAGAAGNAGDICWDADFIYVCVAASTWKKASIATW